MIYLLYLIWGIALTILILFLIKFYSNSIFSFKIKVPEIKPIELPPKIFVDMSIQNENPIMNGLKNIITLGGHSELNEAIYNYKKSYKSYADQYNKSIDLRESINFGLSETGELTYLILGELQKSNKLLNKNSKGIKQSGLITANDLHLQMTNLNRVYNNYQIDTNVSIVGGAISGGLLAVGSWTLVSLLGTASTGTAISTLSGIAAHNAILAWFGGGAIAAGGGGMIAGTFTLGAIVMAPIVIFTTWRTYTKAEEVRQETNKLPAAELALSKENKQLSDTDVLIKTKIEHLKKQLDIVKKINDRVYNIIYPNSFASELNRSLRQFLNKDFYTSEEAIHLDELNRFVDEAYELFEEMQKTSSLLGLPTLNKDIT